jgi:hypothetical protein
MLYETSNPRVLETKNHATQVDNKDKHSKSQTQVVMFGARAGPSGLLLG